MRHTKVLTLLGLLVVAFGLDTIAGIHMDRVQAAPAEKPRIYELRTYTTNDGKLDDLHARFNEHTNQLFVKHGMTLIGYWTHADGEHDRASKPADNTLVYLIAHEDADSAQASWRAFGSDEEWRQVYADSRKDGPLVQKIESQYLIPTDYSPLR